MRRKKIGIVLTVAISCMLSLAGCSKSEPTKGKEISVDQTDENPGTQTGTQVGEGQETEVTKPSQKPVLGRLFQLGDTIEPEDWNPGNTKIRKTELGYYYNSTEKQGIRYVDEASGNEMFLCNKPECRHDGNAFCVATNKKLFVRNFCMYSGNLFAVVMEEKETSYAYKLYSVALDGSEMNEVVTFYEFVKGEESPTYSEDAELLIHRNKVIFPMMVKGYDTFEDTYHYGMAIYDFDTKEVSFLDKEPVSKDNPERYAVAAYGDSVYYCVRQNKKVLLYRYDLVEKTEVKQELLGQFNGWYVVIDDATVVYIRSDRPSLFVYHSDTGENEEKIKLSSLANIVSLKTDGTYIYVEEDDMEVKWTSMSGKRETITTMNFHVLTQELELVQTVDLADCVLAVEMEGVPVPLEANPQYYSYVGEDVYCVFMEKYNSANKHVYKCKRSDLLAGKPEFIFVYKDESAAYFGAR